MSIKGFEMGFEGEVLQRGFWLYVWEIVCGQKVYLYVGRTGDSSSPHASSPFNRIGQHLDPREKAKGNSLAKRLKEAGVNPKTSKFRMLALGPLFPEQESFEAHKPYRDQMATLEYETTAYLREKQFTVLGKHHLGRPVPQDIVEEIKSKVLRFLNKTS
ncbi:MAG: hypothetical protein WA081_06050 [Desulfosalsimonadaceae bacterium]